MLQEFGNAFAFILLAALLPPLILGISKFLRPSFPHSGKLEPYECGEEVEGSAYVMFNNRFYLVAIVFLVFDVEVAMLFPVLKLFRSSVLAGEGLHVFLLAFGFLTVLLLGLIYEIKKGDISWMKDTEDRLKALRKNKSFETKLMHKTSEG